MQAYLNQQASSGTGGSGTVTSVSVATANGVSGSVANPTTTPAITLTLGAITPTTVNGLTITPTAGTLTIPNNAAAALVTSGNFSITLTATGATSVTLPTSGTLVSSVTTGNGVSATNTGGALAFTLGAITPTTIVTTGVVTITINSANALAVGANGVTNPVLNVDASTSSVATGLNIKGAAAAAGLAVSTISSGTNENLTIDAKGSGTVTINGTASGIVILPAGSTIGGSVPLTSTITSSSATAFQVGPNGATNPSFLIDASTASAATGIKIKSAAAAAGVALSVISSGAAENLTVDAKGTGIVTIGGASTGGIIMGGSSGSSIPLTITQAAATSGTIPTGFVFTAAAHTGQAASGGNYFDINFNMGRTITFSSGSTVGFAEGLRVAPATFTAAGATTITQAATITLTAAPTVGANVSITNSYALYAGGPINVVSTASYALVVGANGVTNPVLNVDASTSSVATGLNIKGAAATGGLAVSVISSGTNENLTLNAKGSGTISLATVSTGGVALGQKITTYNNVATAGYGVGAIVAQARSVAQSAAVASVAAYTLPASDGSFIVSANVLVTASTTHSFSVTVTYTDEGNTSRTLNLNFSVVAGTLSTSIVNTGGTVPYEGVPLRIRCKASTTITIATSGTFTSVTYNVEGAITQVA